jgi:hypothetical protein
MIALTRAPGLRTNSSAVSPMKHPGRGPLGARRRPLFGPEALPQAHGARRALPQTLHGRGGTGTCAPLTCPFGRNAGARRGPSARRGGVCKRGHCSRCPAMPALRGRPGPCGRQLTCGRPSRWMASPASLDAAKRQQCMHWLAQRSRRICR